MSSIISNSNIPQVVYLVLPMPQKILYLILFVIEYVSIILVARNKVKSFLELIVSGSLRSHLGSARRCSAC